MLHCSIHSSMCSSVGVRVFVTFECVYGQLLTCIQSLFMWKDLSMLKTQITEQFSFMTLGRVGFERSNVLHRSLHIPDILISGTGMQELSDASSFVYFHSRQIRSSNLAARFEVTTMVQRFFTHTGKRISCPRTRIST